MILQSNQTGFWIVDGFLFVLSLGCGVITYFAPEFMPLLSANIAYYIPFVINFENFDSWLHRVVVILSGLGVLCAIIFGYLNYRINKKTKGPK